MGEWNTLHLFDKEKYMDEIVPQVKDAGHYFERNLKRMSEDCRLKRLVNYCPSKEEYINFVKELNDELNMYGGQSNYSSVAEFHKDRLIENIFSSVAYFFPYFILGKRIFTGAVKAKANSVAEELTRAIMYSNSNRETVLDIYDHGVRNWLDKYDVELLYFDLDNIHATTRDGDEYVDNFKAFVGLAYQNNLGLITLREPCESTLSRLSPISEKFINYITENDIGSVVMKDETTMAKSSQLGKIINADNEQKEKVKHKIYIKGNLKYEFLTSINYDTATPAQACINNLKKIASYVPNVRIESFGKEYIVENDAQFKDWVKNVFSPTNSSYECDFSKYL